MTDAVIAGLAVLAVALGSLVFRRDEDALVRVWNRLHSRRAADVRRDLVLQIAGQELLLRLTRALAQQAEAVGRPLEAARLAAEERLVRADRGALLVLRRMLWARGVTGVTLYKRMRRLGIKHPRSHRSPKMGQPGTAGMPRA